MIKDLYTRAKPQIAFFIIYTVLFAVFALTLSVTLPFIIGLLTALLLQPIFSFMRRKLKFKRSFAAVIATAIIFASIFGLLAWLVITLINESISLVIGISNTDTGALLMPVKNFIQKLGSYINKIDGDFFESHQDEILSFAGGGVTVISNLLSLVIGFFSSLPKIFTMIIVTVFSTYYFTKQIKQIKYSFKGLLSTSANQNMSKIYEQGGRLIGKFIRSYMIVYLVTFIQSVIVFWVLGIKYPLLIGFITGIADIVPILGPGIIYIPLAALQFILGKSFAGWGLLIAWLIITVIREIIEPKIISQSVQVHPLVMLAALYGSLVLHSITVLLYIISICVVYQLLVKVELIKPFFENQAEQQTVN